MTESNDLAQACEKAKETLRELLARMEFESTIDAAGQNGNEVLLKVESPEASRLIGRQAQMLDALQHILNRMVRGRTPLAEVHCIVDVESYRARRQERLQEEAQEAAAQVRGGGRPFVFAPLGSAERRLIHQALRNEADLETLSEAPDEQGNKRLIVRLRPGSAAAAQAAAAPTPAAEAPRPAPPAPAAGSAPAAEIRHDDLSSD